MKKSVCMAVYNGSQYIHEQIASILPQMGLEDEIVVVDDASKDASVAILDGFQDRRIRVFRQTENQGVVRSFERALRESSGEIIFLADQDDIWHPDKIEEIVKTFNSDPRVTLVQSNGELIDSGGRSLSKQLNANDRFRPGVLSNLIQNRYQGAALAFRREVLDAALPFPVGIPMHDSWIGLVNAIVGRAAYLPDRLVLYRRHGNNITVGRHGTVARMLADRGALTKSLICRAGTLMRVRRNLRERAKTVLQARSGLASGPSHG